MIYLPKLIFNDYNVFYDPISLIKLDIHSSDIS